MMKFLTTAQVKAQLRIDDDIYDIEKSLIEDVYAASAETFVLNYCNRTIEDLVEEYGEIPAPLIQSALLLTNQSYEQRSPITTQQLSMVPYQNLDALCRYYMIL